MCHNSSNPGIPKEPPKLLNDDSKEHTNFAMPSSTHRVTQNAAHRFYHSKKPPTLLTVQIKPENALLQHDHVTEHNVTDAFKSDKRSLNENEFTELK